MDPGKNENKIKRCVKASLTVGLLIIDGYHTLDLEKVIVVVFKFSFLFPS